MGTDCMRLPPGLVGGGLARAAWGGFIRVAKEIAEQGSFAGLAQGANGGELNALFKERAKH